MKQPIYKTLFACFLLLCALSVGCGGNIVKGKVTFDDGEPLPLGTVQFESNDQIFYGKIHTDGFYTLATDTGKKENVPNGSYRVCIVGAIGEGKKMAPIGGVDYNRIIPESLIDKKYTMASTSGLTCDVKGKTTFDITVTKP